MDADEGFRELKRTFQTFLTREDGPSQVYAAQLKTVRGARRLRDPRGPLAPPSPPAAAPPHLPPPTHTFPPSSLRTSMRGTM